jgi:hypothetical protein
VKTFDANFYFDVESDERFTQGQPMSSIKAVDSAWGTVAGAKNLAGPVC